MVANNKPDSTRQEDRNGGRKRNPWKARLGARIKESREAQHASQADLAKAVGGITAGAVGQWEVGLSCPQIEKLPGLSEFLRISLDALLSDAKRRERPADTGPLATGVQLDTALLNEAHTLGIDVPAVLNEHLRGLVGRVRRERWLHENREALADANAFLARHGLWSDGRRQF